MNKTLTKDTRKGRNYILQNYVHLVFLTKYTGSVLIDKIQARLKDILNETCQQMKCQLIEFEGATDHVILLVLIHPTVSISKLVGKLKSKSSYFLVKEFPEHLGNKIIKNHLWSSSYCAVSYQNNATEITKNFIVNNSPPDKAS
ncbi:MAG: IS200/IS605 family transposase [Blastocatellia bacterium]